MRCRHCSTELTNTFIDLGSSPPSNSYVSKEALKDVEQCYPLRVMVCDHCWLVQTEDFVKVDEMFASDYAYYSSYSTSWLDHAKNYVEKVSSKFYLNSNSMVVEIAANDGYLLQYVKDKNIPLKRYNEISEIIEYNKMDCVILMEILEYLRHKYL